MGIINLKIRWEKERKRLNKDMKKFDKEYMKKNQEHVCASMEIFDNGTWYCNHLINARIRKFKERLEMEDRLLINILPKLKAR